MIDVARYDTSRPASRASIGGPGFALTGNGNAGSEGTRWHAVHLRSRNACRPATGSPPGNGTVTVGVPSTLVTGFVPADGDPHARAMAIAPHRMRTLLMGVPRRSPERSCHDGGPPFIRAQRPGQLSDCCGRHHRTSWVCAKLKLSPVARNSPRTTNALVNEGGRFVGGSGASSRAWPLALFLHRAGVSHVS